MSVSKATKKATKKVGQVVSSQKAINEVKKLKKKNSKLQGYNDDLENLYYCANFEIVRLGAILTEAKNYMNKIDFWQSNIIGKELMDYLRSNAKKYIRTDYEEDDPELEKMLDAL